MSIVGSYLFSKLVLPAIAVQAKEADIDEGHHSQVAPVASVPVNPMYGPGHQRDNLTSHTGMVAAPAFSSRRDLSLARFRSQAPPQSGAYGDPLYADLMAFRQWQAGRGGGGGGVGSMGSPLPPIEGNTPQHRGSFSANATSPNPYPFQSAPLSSMRGSSASPGGGGTTNIIVVNSSSGNDYRPSNLGTTNDPGYKNMQGSPDISMLTLQEQGLISSTHHGGMTSMGSQYGGSMISARQQSAEVPVVDLDAIREEEEMRKEAELNGTAADPSQLKLDVNEYPATTAVLATHHNPTNTTPTAMNTIEQTKIVPVIEDGKLVNKQVAHNVTYSNDQLYTAATQFYHRLLAEAVGTWALVFFIAGVNIEASIGHLDQMGVAIASGLVFVFLIYSLGQVSGAHFNPIVTYAFVLRGMFPLTWLPFYWVVQFVGALIGAAMLLGFYGPTIGGAGATIVPDAYSEKAGFLMEAVLCFVLVFAILSMASRAKIVGPHAALAIGAVISFNVFLAGSYSGASMNPWRSVCVSIVFPVSFYSIWVYFAGPFLGATIAVIAVFALAGKPRSDELTAGIGATIAVAIGNSISREVEGNEEEQQAQKNV